jgi:hypothetical protein
VVDLDKYGERLLALLVEQLSSAVPNNPATFITYKQVHDRLGLEQLRGTYGESLKPQGLSNLADWTAANGYPGITGLIIDGTSKMPGEGYFRLFHKTGDDFRWWEEQIKESINFDWSPYLADARLPSVPTASDIREPGEREKVTVSRVIRDTVVSRRVKALHQYKCQICSHVIILRDGSRYAEAHHIRPLGGDHEGPDVAENVLCLCPNHHAEMDYGVRPINLSDLRLVRGHCPDEDYVQYHNGVICR